RSANRSAADGGHHVGVHERSPPELGAMPESEANLVERMDDRMQYPADAAPATPALASRAPGWIRRRARNVYRRPLLVSAVGLTVFVAVLIAAVVAPLQERRAVRATLPPARVRPDTIAIKRHIEMAGSVLLTTDSALVVARQTNAAAFGSVEYTHDSAVAALASAHRWLDQARDVDRDMDADNVRAKSAEVIGASV